MVSAEAFWVGQEGRARRITENLADYLTRVRWWGEARRQVRVRAHLQVGGRAAGTQQILEAAMEKEESRHE